MKKIIIEHLHKLEKKEQKILNAKKSLIDEKLEPIMEKVESKVPENVRKAMDAAFDKSFRLVFSNGTKYIEKLYNKEKIQFNYNVNDCKIDRTASRRNLKKIDNHALQSKFINASISAIEGAGLGLLGMGLPDIPLFTAVILKTIYEISLSYGFVYELDDEKIYILNLICAALSKDEEQKILNSRVDEISTRIDSHVLVGLNLDDEITQASKILSDSMLASKFVQGIPVVGAVGSFTNYKIVSRISKYSSIKYKKRYLNNKK
ncbi:MAG: EcsC family protein [Sedimentibacter sp.]|uniref:EcsC family protein n=1 Tax=Sedimentibacter sp. TaxID=1960295 RepID=UPI003158AD8B